MTVTLLLMTQKGLEVLNALLNNGYKDIVNLVVIGKDANVTNDFSDDIALVCKQHNVDFSWHKDDYRLISDYTLAVSWRWLVKDVETTKLIVFHDSLLPKYRGFSPLVNCLINNEKTIGVTCLFATEDYDKGAIIFQEAINITYPIKIKEAIEQVAKLYTILALKVLNHLKVYKTLPSQLQDESKASYSLWRNENDYFIDWYKDADYIKRCVDALGTPFLGAKCYVNDAVVTINEATVVDDVFVENRDVGKVIFNNKGKPVIVCGKGLLQIDDAIFDTTKESFIPIKKFRIRLK